MRARAHARRALRATQPTLNNRAAILLGLYMSVVGGMSFGTGELRWLAAFVVTGLVGCALWVISPWVDYFLELESEDETEEGEYDHVT
jgi:hypothetical protein